MTDDTEELLARFKRLQDERRVWEAHWQELAEVMLPRRADFTGARAEGEKRTEQIFDGTPMLARRGLAAAIDGLLKPKTARWFRLAAADEELEGDDSVKRWLEDSEARLYRALYNRRAGFIQRSGEVDDDLVTFGTGCLFIGESRSLDRLLFRAYHLRDVFVAENGDGVIDMVFLRQSLSARQAAGRYGAERLGREAREALAGGAPERRFTYLQAVLPRGHDERAKPSGGQDGAALPFAAVVIELESAHRVAEGGYHEFPFAIPRWDTASGEVYGRSPGMVALADAKTLQQMGKTLLVAGQKAVDPPLLAGDDALLGAPKAFPGGITYFDMQAARDLGRIPVEPLQTGFNLPLGREMQADTREQIWAAFFRNVLQLPVASPRMTATEVLERKEEFIRTIGPVFGRLEGDYIGQVVERGFAILLRAGALPPLPPALRGRALRFSYASPVEQARRQIEAAGAGRAIELLAPFVQADPGILDNFDGDAMARDATEIFGLPQRWLRPRAEVEARRAARAGRGADGAGAAVGALLERLGAAPGNAGEPTP